MECDDFVMSNIGRDFTQFDYGPWNVMITCFFPAGDDEDEEDEDTEGEEEAVSDPAPATSKAKASPAMVGLTMRSKGRGKPTMQLAGSATVRPTLKGKMGPPTAVGRRGLVANVSEVRGDVLQLIPWTEHVPLARNERLPAWAVRRQRRHALCGQRTAVSVVSTSTSSASLVSRFSSILGYLEQQR